MKIDRELLDLLDSFAGLPDNWDSYGGVATDKRAIAKAKELLSVLPGGPWQAVPGPGGDLQLELHSGGFDIEILIEASNVRGEGRGACLQAERPSRPTC